MNSATLGEKKNVNLPGVIVKLPTVTEKDIDDLVNFGVKEKVDMIAASFVRKAQDVHTIREILGKDGEFIKIISKIENQEGLMNLEVYPSFDQMGLREDLIKGMFLFLIKFFKILNS